MENTNVINIFKNEINEEENSHNEEFINRNGVKPAANVQSSLIVKAPIQENVREKRIRKQKHYDDDYVLFNTTKQSQKLPSHHHQHQQHQQHLNLSQDDYIKIEKLDYENNLLVVNNNLESTNMCTSMQNSPSNEIKFNVGNLVWAKVSGHPWWPCSVAIDYSEDNHVKLVGTNRPKRMFYVEFFGPSVEHAWVTEGCLIEYKGIEAFKTYAQDQVDQAPTKSQKEKLAERFQLKVALTRRDHWERAVEEADSEMNKRRTNKIANNNDTVKTNVAYNTENEENLINSKRITTSKRNSTSSTVTNEDINVNIDVKSKSRVAALTGNVNKSNKRKRLSSLANSEDKVESNSLKLKKIVSNNNNSKHDHTDGSSYENLDSTNSSGEFFHPNSVDKFNKTEHSANNNLSSSVSFSSSDSESSYTLSSGSYLTASRLKSSSSSSSLISLCQSDEYLLKNIDSSCDLTNKFSEIVKRSPDQSIAERDRNFKNKHNSVKCGDDIINTNEEMVNELINTKSNWEISINNIDDLLLQSKSKEANNKILSIQNSKNYNCDNLTHTIDFMIEEAQQEQQKRQYEESDVGHNESIENVQFLNTNQNNETEENEDVKKHSKSHKQKKRGRKPKLLKNQFLIDQNNNETYTTATILRGTKRYISIKKSQQDNLIEPTLATDYSNQNNVLNYLDNFDIVFSNGSEHEHPQQQQQQQQQEKQNTYEAAEIQASSENLILNKRKPKKLIDHISDDLSKKNSNKINNNHSSMHEHDNYKILNKIDLNNITNSSENENYYDFNNVESYSNNSIIRNEFELDMNEDNDEEDDDDDDYNININSEENNSDDDTSDENYSDVEKINRKKQKSKNSSLLKSKRKQQRTKSMMSDTSIDINQISMINISLNKKAYSNSNDDNTDNLLISKKVGSAETYLIDRYKYAVRHIKQGLSVDEACNKYRISKGALLKCLSGGTAPRGKKTRLTENEENSIVEWLIANQNLKYNEAIHLVFEEVVNIFQKANRPNPFHNGKPSMDWWYDFLSRHPQIMASKPEWLRRGKVNDQYILDVQSGKLKCTKFRRALLSAIQYIRSLNDANSTSNQSNGNYSSSESGTIKNAQPLTVTTTLSNDGCSSQVDNSPRQLSNSIGSRIIKTMPVTLNSKQQVNRLVNKKSKKKLHDLSDKIQLKATTKQTSKKPDTINLLKSEQNEPPKPPPPPPRRSNNSKNNFELNTQLVKLKRIPGDGDVHGAARINLIKNSHSNNIDEMNSRNNNKNSNRNESKSDSDSLKLKNSNLINENEFIEQLKSSPHSQNADYCNSINYEQNNFIDSILSTHNNNNASCGASNSNSNNNSEKHYDLENRRLIFKFKLGQQNQHLLLPDDDDDDDDADDIDNLKDSIDPSAFLP